MPCNTGLTIDMDRKSSVIADFSQLCGRLVVFVLFRGEFWSVKLIETRVSTTSMDLRETNRNKTSKQKSTIGLYTILLIGLSFKYERPYLVLSPNLISILYVNR